MISNWLSVFEAPGIIVVAKDSRYIGEIFREFCNARYIVPHTVIPGRHQSLGATERRRGHCRMIIDHMIGRKKPNSSGGKNGVNSRQWR